MSVESDQALYAAICARLTELTTVLKPSYSQDGKSVSWGELFNELMAAKKQLEEKPGVVPDAHPTFEIFG